MIDTNIVIYLLNGDKTISELLRGKQIFISFITELELLGLKSLTAKEEKQIENLLQEYQVIEMNKQIKQVYKASI